MFPQYCAFILLSVNESLIIKVKETNKKYFSINRYWNVVQKIAIHLGKEMKGLTKNTFFFHPFYERLSLLLTN